MRRSISLITLAAVLVASLSLPATAQTPEGPPVVFDGVRAYSVTPPGQDGTITPREFAEGDYCPHYSDQLEMYASLIEDEDNDVTEEELLDYFHSLQFGPGETIERTYSPDSGMTIYRDGFGIPHIYADSLEKASYALGYTAAEDRIFQMDIFRRAARGTLSEFLGPGKNDAFLKMDIDTRREGYTEAEVQKMFNQLNDKFGASGAKIQAGVQAYTDGVNAYIGRIRTRPERQPVEYSATGNPPPAHPRDWTPTDTMFIVILQLRAFGETAGTELQNAGIYNHLRGKLGKKQGKRLFNELLFQNDPNSPTTISRKDGDFSTQKLGPVDPRSIAVPDQAEKVAERTQEREKNRWEVLESLGFRKQTSNALVVSAERSESGNPLLLGGPQVGHAVPSFFLDIDVHFPGVDFRGPAVPGTNALIPLGRGRDYAWTLTTGYSDAVDTRAELLCEPKGGKPSMDSNGYMFRGKCKAMKERTETFIVKPPPTNPGTPRTERRTFYRTQHGPVFERATVDGKPVAFVKERFFWKKEIDSLPSFYKWNAKVRSIEDFAKAARGFTMSFNSFYADAEDTGYFHVGMYPVRKEGVHPSLPTWGTGKWEWQGRRSYSKQPKIIRPGQGWLSNWNNKPARHWNNQDNFKWGVIQRVRFLQNHMQTLMSNGGKVALSDLVDVIRVAATRDARGAYLGPHMVRKAAKDIEVTGKPQQYGPALEVVKAWISTGAHRRNADRDGVMDQGPAWVIFDAWYNNLVHAIFDDEIGDEGYQLMASDAPITNYNPQNGGGFFFDFSSYVQNMMRPQLRRDRFSRNLCDDKETETKESCTYQSAVALKLALEQVVKDQGEDISTWEKDAENITFDELGAGSVEDIPWQNRGTENHLVELVEKAPDALP